jgi:hypothetical protein
LAGLPATVAYQEVTISESLLEEIGANRLD